MLTLQKIGPLLLFNRVQQGSNCMQYPANIKQDNKVVSAQSLHAKRSQGRNSLNLNEGIRNKQLRPCDPQYTIQNGGSQAGYCNAGAQEINGTRFNRRSRGRW